MDSKERVYAALVRAAEKGGRPPPPPMTFVTKKLGATSSTIPSRILPCVLRGDTTGREVTCPTCRGGTQLKTFSCPLHVECTVARSVAGVSCCKTCPDHRAFPSITTRHLAYHVYPVIGSRWRERIEVLRKFLPAFNGLKVVAVATDARTDSTSEVDQLLDGTGAEILPLVNRPDRQEVNSFLPLFERVQNTSPNDMVVFAHAKGVTRPPNTTCHRWVSVLEDVFYGHLPAVERLLTHFPVVGAFKKLGRGWKPEESESAWHYSGSWFAARNASLFSKPDWRRINQFWCGIECYPSNHFSSHEAGFLIHEAPVPIMNLYNSRYWSRTIEPLYAKFLVENRGLRTVLPPIVTESPTIEYPPSEG